MVDIVLRANKVRKVYGGGRGQSPVLALNDVSLEIERGRTMGIVGESGCGKSTLSRLLVGLESVTSGTLTIDGQLVATSRGGASKSLARKIQLVFQDPFSSLDPRMTVEKTLREVLSVHHLYADGPAQRVDELLSMVGLTPRFATRYPHELSGGQAQRVAIARALAVEPEILVLDEPTSALDVSVRAEIINLLVRIQDDLKLTYLFISHDLSMVRHFSENIAVMYRGRVVEFGRYDQIFSAPLHPYTRALAEAIPVADPAFERARKLSHLSTAPLSAYVATEGCAYAERCPQVEDQCRITPPELVNVVDGHEVACFIALRNVRS